MRPDRRRRTADRQQAVCPGLDLNLRQGPLMRAVEDHALKRLFDTAVALP